MTYRLERVTAFWHFPQKRLENAQPQNEDLEIKYSRFVALAQTEARLNMIAFDLHEHFINYVKPKGFKAMLTCASRAEAVQIFYKLRDLGGVTPAVVITPNSGKEGDDENNTPQTEIIIGEFFRKEVDPLFKNNYDAYEDSVTGRFIDPEGDVDLLIVKDKLLTGFDAPIAAVLYVDKKLKDHTLLQAIARVNRVYPDKDFGLVVDYMGIFKKLNSALDLYSDEQSGMNLFNRSEIQSAISSVSEEKQKLEKIHQELWKIFKGIAPNESSANVWQERLREHDIRKNFYEKLSAFAKMVDFMFSSYELFEAVGFDQAEVYRKDYLWTTLKQRLHERLDTSKNIVLFLSKNTQNSRALREEIDYGINTKGLPVIVIYPDFKEKSDIWCSTGMKQQVKDLWDKLPVFRDNMDKVATLHVPYRKALIESALKDDDLKVQTMARATQYHYKLN